jgi:hypothetical protein
VQTLVLGWLAHPDASLPQLAQTAARLGLFVHPQAIDQRFSFETAALLRSVLVRSVEQLIAGEPVAIPILQRFNACFVHDSTTIVLPDELADHARGNGGSNSTNSSAALKCGLQLDLLTGALYRLDLSDGRANDQKLPLQHAPLPRAALRLADLGFYDTGVFAAHTVGNERALVLGHRATDLEQELVVGSSTLGGLRPHREPPSKLCHASARHQGARSGTCAFRFVCP